jgi:hypothetical protein
VITWGKRKKKPCYSIVVWPLKGGAGSYSVPPPTSGRAAWFEHQGWQPADQARPSVRDSVTCIGDQVPNCPMRLSACCENWLCCHTKYALATLSWTEMWASLRVSAQHSPAVFSQVVFMRERGRTRLQHGLPRTLRLFLHPFIHARDMWSPESIKTGGSLARAKDIY